VGVGASGGSVAGIPNTQIVQIANKIAVIRTWGWTTTRMRGAPSDPRSAAGRPGNCAIKRMAILPASAGFKDGSDSAACSVASVNPFLSSPIGANRKASNSDPSRELEAGVLMISRSIGSSPVPGSAGRNSLCICVRNPRPRGAPARPAQCCARGHQLLGFSEQSNKA